MNIEKVAFDYIIVGAGTSGSVLASRLVRSGFKVLVVEAGIQETKNHSIIQSIENWAKAVSFGWPVSYNVATVPQINLHKRKIPLGAGCGFGGSTLINAGIYQRGREEDYSDWPWTIDFIKKGFTSIESELVPELQNCSNIVQRINKLIHSVGINEYNKSGELSWTQDGARMNMHFTTKNGSRNTAWNAFMLPLVHMPNLTVIQGYRVRKVIFEGKSAIGVELETVVKNYKSNRSKHRRKIILEKENSEVILCCGALFSPQILMLSGIGEISHLRNHLIPLVHKNPLVGENLQDHLLAGTFSLSKIRIGKEMCSFHGLQELVDFSVDSGSKKSSVQFLLMDNSKMDKIAPFLASWSGMHTRNGGKLASMFQKTFMFFLNIVIYLFPLQAIIRQTLTALIVLTGPTSRGTVRLASSDPSDAPLVDPRYMSSVEDWVAVRKAFNKFKEAQNIEAGKKLYGTEILPGCLYSKAKSEDDFRTWFKDYAMSYFHYCGTCAIGDVVDNNLRVIGVSNLRVADASVAPRIPSSPTQAMSMMIGDRVAQLIIEERGTEVLSKFPSQES